LMANTTFVDLLRDFPKEWRSQKEQV
jgi:hypothetical protein